MADVEASRDLEASREVEVPRDLEVPREIKLKASDGWIFSVPRHVIAKSLVVNSVIESLGLDAKNAPKDPEPILLSTVNGRTLKKVLKWCRHHSGPPETYEERLIRASRPSGLSNWDEEFLETSVSELCEMTTAAYQLHIQDLMDMCCKALADSIMGRPLGEGIQFVFN